MKRIIALTLSALMLLALCACGTPSPAPTAAPAPVVTPEPAPEPTAPPMLTVAFEPYEESFTDDDGTELLNVSYDLPVVSGGQAADAINAYFEARRETFLHSTDEYDTSVDSALEMAGEIREQGYAGEAFALEQSYTVTRLDSSVLCFYGSFYGYLGGAHGGAVFTGVCFDAATGAVVGIDDLSADPQGFKALCAEKVIALAEVDEADGRYWENYRELIPANITDGFWYFSDAGLTFIYNAYDLGSYAAGPFEFTIPFAELEGVLDAKWLPAA